MKKLFFAFLAVLLVCGAAWAVSIPQSEDAENGPAIWLVPVLNNAGAALSAGDLVVWDIDSSTGDDDNYVTTNTTADTFLVAGIVWPNAISDGDRGTIAVRGVVTVNVDGDGPVPIEAAAAGSLMCAGTVAGKSQVCSGGATDADAYGFTTAAPSGATVKTYIFGR